MKNGLAMVSKPRFTLKNDLFSKNPAISMTLLGLLVRHLYLFGQLPQPLYFIVILWS